jgi:hypothetical protein
MIHYTADLSELTSDYQIPRPDVFISAGFALEEAGLTSLTGDVEELKRQLTGYDCCPVKWNMKDLQRSLELHGIAPDFLDPAQIGDALRSGMLSALARRTPSIFLSVLTSHSAQGSTIRRVRPSLVRYSFANLLQRFGLHKQAADPGAPALLTLDWPESNDRHPFVREYFAAWRDGVTGRGLLGSRYFCGPLRALGFHSGLHFGVTDIDLSLQLADLIVGCSRRFLDFAVGHATIQDFGVQCFSQLVPCLPKGPTGTPIGYGIAISPRTSPLVTRIQNALAQL